MLNVEIHFNDTIAKYNLFHQAAVTLLQELHTLSPDKIYHRCATLTAMHHDLMENKDQLFSMMEFLGPGILETAYIGDFQRALDRSITACNSLYQEILAYRELLGSVDRPTTPAITNHFTPISPGTTVQ